MNYRILQKKKKQKNTRVNYKGTQYNRINYRILLASKHINDVPYWEKVLKTRIKDKGIQWNEMDYSIFLLTEFVGGKHK